MAMTPGFLLVLVSVILTVVSFFDNRYPLLQVAVLLLGLALLIR